MKKQVMQVSIMDAIVSADTDGFVDLNDLVNAGNLWRLQNGMPVYQLGTFLNSKMLDEYVNAASIVWDLPKESFLKKSGKNKTSRHSGHVSVAVLLAEQISPVFHATVHKIFIDGKLLEYRLLGGTEFKALNAMIDQYLPSESGSNAGRYINAAKMIRSKCAISKPDDVEITTWNQSAADSVAQRMRYDIESKLVTMISLGLIKDWDGLKDVINRM